ncbi:hypothetical protein [Rufibacter sp. LB8]|uniref:hypothetical protein n=1 Tax=Rufibacter sp. LB8 TaxID=2777781 RepID=UPI00178C5BBF|nr:hypothetical protein [Rufibacter sp. LB8]
MKKLHFLFGAFFMAASSFAQPSASSLGTGAANQHGKKVSTVAKASMQAEATSAVESTSPAYSGTMQVLVETPDAHLPQDQEKPAKTKKDKADQEQKEKPGRKAKEEKAKKAKETAEAGAEKGQDVKEVATAKRQTKPEKVDATADGAAKAPKSAARPGRGAARGVVKGAANTVTKTTGKPAKAVKPVKVGGGVGAGAKVKVGKN